MGYISLGLLIITLVSVGFGALLGLMRGRNRALLRLAIIILCLVLALVLRSSISKFMSTFQYDGMPISDWLVLQVTSGIGMTVPDSIVNLVMALIEIVVGLVVFMLSFILLSAVTMILFWILKIFVPAGDKIPQEDIEMDEEQEGKRRKPAKRQKQKYNRHRGFGTIIGTVQGALVAFVLCVPLTGLFVQVDKVSQIKIDGEPILGDSIPPELGLSNFSEAGIGKVYMATGGWFFDTLTSAKDESGNKVSLDATIDVVTTVTGVADSFTAVTENLGAITSESATTEERVDAMKAVGQSFKEIGESMDALGDDAKDMINNVLSSVLEMFGGTGDGSGNGEGSGSGSGSSEGTGSGDQTGSGEGSGDGSGSGEGEGSVDQGGNEGSGSVDQGGESAMPEEIVEILQDIDIKEVDFVAVGEAMEGMADYIASTEDESGETELTQEDVDAIVNGFAKNTFILNLLKSGGDVVPEIMPVSDEHKAMFKSAIDRTEIEQEYKDLLYQLFGLEK